jgi:glutathione S-transferase
MFGAKAWIAALEKRIEFEVVMVPYNVVTGYEPKDPEVLRVNPKRQVPVLIDGNLEIFDSTQIFEYFEDLQPLPPLWPTEIQLRAKARNLELQSDEVFFPHVIKLMGLQNSLDDPAAVAACAACDRSYEAMERVIGEQPFLCGTLSYVDIAFYMAQLFAGRLGAPMSTATPRLLQWRERMSSRESVGIAVTPLAEFLHANARPVPDYLRRFEPAGN